MSLRYRLNLMITLAMLAVMAVGGMFAVHSARRSVLEEVGSSVNMALQLIGAGLAHADGDEARLLAWLAELARMEKTRHLRIQVRQAPAKLIKLDSAPPPAAGGRVPAWFAWAVTPDLLAGEKRIDWPGGGSARILVLADPADEIAEAWREAEETLALVAALAASVYALVHTALGRAFRAVTIISEGLEGIEQGDFDKRLPRFALPEFDRISQAFNHTAQALEKARAENQALARHSLALQEEERSHIARELHDELGQSLSAVKAMVSSLRRHVRDGKGAETLEAVLGLCDRLFATVRAMMRRLRPMLLDEFGLAASLEEMVESWRARNPGVEAALDCGAGVEEGAGRAKIHLFRIVQEALTNVTKHAGARRVDIRLRRAGGWIELEIRDDGRGFDPARPPAGFGLLGMKERADSLGGRLSVRAAEGRGATINARVPCRSPA